MVSRTDRPTTADDVLSFWFNELTPGQWFKKDPALDQSITERFGQTLAAAARGECKTWHTSAKGRLAEIIVLDQFSRNVYRDRPEAFAQDPLARERTYALLSLGADAHLSVEGRIFAYMPLMHSEALDDHDRALALFDHPGMAEQLDYERRHRAVIQRFGRYPHRNAILGRESTPDELEFLAQPGSSF